jgi:protoheme IX farnesyltransferase
MRMGTSFIQIGDEMVKRAVSSGIGNSMDLSPTMSAYFELTKPRISTMVLITIVVAATLAAPGTIPVSVVANVAIGMFLVAASGNAMNMYLERYSDFLMKRTVTRPLPDRRLTSQQVVLFAAITFGIGIPYLLLTTNWQTASCALLTWLLYVAAYTPLKRLTPLNTEVGAVAGALPVLCGGLAVSSALDPFSWGLFTLLLFWQFPHFMAIAWLYREEYAKGGLKMLTVTEPTGAAAGRKAILMAIATGAAGFIPLLGIDGRGMAVGFAVSNTLLAAGYLHFSWQFARERTRETARRLLRTSIIYLPLYMILLLIVKRFS